MNKLRIILFAITVAAVSFPASAQTLEHLHLSYASRVKNTPPSDIFASRNGVVRALFGSPYRWDTIAREWLVIKDPYIGDSENLNRTLISPSGLIYDYFDSSRLSSWLTRSTDGGNTFLRLPVTGRSMYLGGQVALGPTGELIVSGLDYVLRSEDNGQTWDSIYAPAFLRNAQFDKTGNYIILQSGAHAPWTIYRLSLDDTTFDSVGTCPILFSQESLISTSPAPNLILVASGIDSMYLFDEKRDSWEGLPFPLGGIDNIATLCCDSSFNIYAGTHSGNLLRSSDTGHTWQLIAPGTGGLVWTAFQYPSTLWLASQSHVMKYSLSTNTLTGCDAPFEVLDTWMVADKGDTVYAGVEDDSGFFKSTDDGNTWMQPLRDSGMAMGSESFLGFAPDGSTYLRTDMQLLKSFGGEVWQNAFPNSMYDLYMAIDSSSNLLLANSSRTYYASSNEGFSWNQYGQAILPEPLYYPEVTFQGYFCGAVDSLFEYSTDHGLTWKTSIVNDTFARGFAFVHSAAGHIWLDYDSVVILSTDGGQTWQRAMQGLSHAPKQDITTDPKGNTFCIQGKWLQGLWWPDSSSIYVWNGSMNAWHMLMPLPNAEGLGPQDTSLFVYSLCANSKYLFIGTQSGVFRVAISDFNLGVPQTSSSTLESAVAYPNPSSNGFAIRFYLNQSSPVTITIYDAVGRSVEHFNTGEHEAGWISIPVASGLPPGAYTYQVIAAGATLRGRVAIVSP